MELGYISEYLLLWELGYISEYLLLWELDYISEYLMVVKTWFHLGVPDVCERPVGLSVKKLQFERVFILYFINNNKDRLIYINTSDHLCFMAIVFSCIKFEV